MKRRQHYKRGYPVAILIGIENDHAVVWHVFSQVAKPHTTIKLTGNRTDGKALYNFHESIMDALKPSLKEGTKSIIATAPTKTTFAANFLDHIRKHHTYLTQPGNPNKATFAELEGFADKPHEVAELVKTKEYRRIITETTSDEADNILDTLENHLSNINGNSLVLFSLKEIEDAVYIRDRQNDFRTEYLILTDKYLTNSENKNRIHRLLQISKNKKVKTRIVNAETPQGKRISQFGGLVFFSAPTK